jgi:hypothetical protein|tara:strand:- start:6578 stop:7378 length:801 start_codon:yes stop_codon:yes gene_type:complete
MPITVQRAKAAVLLACGGNPSTATGMTVDERVAEIINSAGHQLFHHGWSWKERTATTNLQFTAGSSSVTLPADSVLNEVLSGQILSVVPNGNTFRTVQFVSPEKFGQLEANNLELTDGQFFILVTKTDTNFGTAINDVRLEIYPKPSTTDSTALIIRYRRNFPNVRSTDVTGSDTSANASLLFELPVDDTAIALFLEYIRAFGEGGEYGDASQRVAAVEAGPIYDQALRRDGTTAPNYGAIPLAVRKGSAYSGLNFFPNGSIPDPS